LLPSFAPHNLSERWPPRLKLHVADARRFARSVREPYDVIVADLFHPARDGAGALYTREHFRALRSCLAPGGLLCQWLPLYQLDGPALRSILRAFLDVFPDAHAVLLRVTLDTPVLGLVSGLAPGRYGADWFERRVGDPVLREALRQTGLASGMQLLGSLLAAPSALDAYCRDAPMNTDDRPLVLFEAPRLHATRPGPSHAAVLLELLALGGAGCDRLLASGDEPANRGFRLRFNAYIEARTLYVRGLVAEAEKRTAAAVDAFVESTRRSGDFTTGYAHVLNLAARRWAGAPTEAARWLERLIEARPERPVAGELLRRLRASAGGTGAPVALETPQP
jgi:spermidine synthase